MIPEEKLDLVVARYRELADALAGAPESREIVRLSKEYAELTPVVEAISELRLAEAEARDLEMLMSDGDEDVRGMAEQEFQEIKESVPRLEHELRLLLLPKDAADDRNAILEVRAGTGGDEAALFAADLFRMYHRYAEIRDWKVETMHTSGTGIGGYKEAVASVSGKGVSPASVRVRRAQGTTCAGHGIQRPHPYLGGHRRGHARGRGRRRPSGRQGPANRRLPGQRARRPVRQHHR